MAWGEYLVPVQWESCDWGTLGKQVLMRWHLAGFGKIASVYRVARGMLGKGFLRHGMVLELSMLR